MLKHTGDDIKEMAAISLSRLRSPLCRAPHFLIKEALLAASLASGHGGSSVVTFWPCPSVIQALRHKPSSSRFSEQCQESNACSWHLR
jgi:hypothetical protein